MENVYIYEVCHNNGIESLYTHTQKVEQTALFNFKWEIE